MRGTTLETRTLGVSCSHVGRGFVCSADTATKHGDSMSAAHSRCYPDAGLPGVQ
jgi:hypothetical protein